MSTEAAFFFGAVCGISVMLVVLEVVGGSRFELRAKHELFRDIANQQCAPKVALISVDDPYRYVCVEPER